MKLTLSLLAAVAALGLASPTIASADHCHAGGRRIVSHLPCGRPVFAHYEICGYDRAGRPVGHWETERASCACPVCKPKPVVHSRPYCAPSPHRHAHGSRVEVVRPGFSLGYSFGR